MSKDGTKPRPDPQPFYAPYTGPGFGNPDAKSPDAQPVGKSRRKYHDASGTSAYSKGGNDAATALTPPPRKPKRGAKKDDKETPASPPAGEKR